MRSGREAQGSERADVTERGVDAEQKVKEGSREKAREIGETEAKNEDIT